MIAVVQRVNTASIEIENIGIISEIKEGILILLGITHEDQIEDIEWLSSKIINLRIFDDENNIMNYSCIDKNYDVLIVSQFTLLARTKKGNRPSYIDAAEPEKAEKLYLKFIETTEKLLNKKIKTGKFGANMKVNLVNNGPVTIIIDTKNKK